MNHIRKNLQFIIGLAVAIGVVVAVGIFARPQAENELKVYFLDVGQGDSAYIKTPTGEDILIDGGPDNSVLGELGKVMDFGDHRINLIILTHPHADHLTGLLEVMRRYTIDEVWETGVEYSSSTYDAWKKEIQRQNITDKYILAGDEKNFAEVKIAVLYPLSSLENKTMDNTNNASMVNRLDYDKFSVLFMGDGESEVQRKLIDKDIFADILKVAHHGSDNGLSEDFLKVVRPAMAIISVGSQNKYGHPALATINLLKAYAVRILRTDQSGTIEVDSNGQTYWVETF